MRKSFLRYICLAGVAISVLTLSGCKLPFMKAGLSDHLDKPFTEALNSLHGRPRNAGIEPLFYYNKGLANGNCVVYAGSGEKDMDALSYLRVENLYYDSECIMGGMVRLLVMYDPREKLFSVYSWEANKDLSDAIFEKRKVSTALSGRAQTLSLTAIYHVIEKRIEQL